MRICADRGLCTRREGASNDQTAIAAYTEAIRLDPKYALAFAGRSQALSGYASECATGTAVREVFDKSKADARQALALAPELAQGHLALAAYFQRGSLDFAAASEAFERAMALAPGDAVVLGEGGRFAAQIGRFDVGIAAARRAVALDPLSARSRCVARADALYAAAGMRRRLPLTEKCSVSSLIQGGIRLSRACLLRARRLPECARFL